MASNYETICEENRLRYGTEGAQKSGGLAAGLYDNRTHFIFDLLQIMDNKLRTVCFAVADVGLNGA